MTEPKKIKSIKSLKACWPMIGTNHNEMQMCVNVISMAPYHDVEFTFDSLMEQLSTEGLPQKVQVRVGSSYSSKLIAGEYAVSDMVEIVKDYYNKGHKVFIQLRHQSGYNGEISFQKKETVPAGAASAATPFRSRRRGSKSVQRRRKLGSKSISRKRSSKPRRR